ncbi:hypothetical protein ABPG75_009479 [Micractinium tetrahymenae]
MGPPPNPGEAAVAPGGDAVHAAAAAAAAAPTADPPEQGSQLQARVYQLELLELAKKRNVRGAEEGTGHGWSGQQGVSSAQQMTRRFLKRPGFYSLPSSSRTDLAFNHP